MSTKVVGTKLHSSGWCSKRSSSGGSTVSNALDTPAPAASARAFSTAKKAAAWSGLKGSRSVCVRTTSGANARSGRRSRRARRRRSRGGSPRDRGTRTRRRAPRRLLRLAVADLLHALDGLVRLLPELAGFTPLAVGEREHARRSFVRRRDRDRAARAPDEVGGVGADHQELARHAAPASRRDCPTIISRTSSSSNPPPSRRSAQSASPSSTGG